MFKSLDFTLRDANLIDKMMADYVKRHNASATSIRARTVTEVAMTFTTELGGGPAAEAIGNAAANFIARPQILHIPRHLRTGRAFPTS